MSRALPILLLLVAGLTRPAAPPVHAQSPYEPFDTIELRLSGNRNVNRNLLHEYWGQGQGGEVAFATPFYLGYAELGGAFHRYETAVPTVPGFDALLVFAGWGLRAEPFSRIQLESGVRVGNYRMVFEEQTFTGVRNESELALMAQARIGLRPVGPVLLHVSGTYLQVYTHTHMKLWYASAGLSLRMHSPEWLKDVLR